jgi:hypothetical protein
MNDANHSYQQENEKLAEEFAQKGTLKHYLLRKGFLPHDEKAAEAILDGIIEEWEARNRYSPQP